MGKHKFDNLPKGERPCAKCGVNPRYGTGKIMYSYCQSCRNGDNRQYQIRNHRLQKQEEFMNTFDRVSKDHIGFSLDNCSRIVLKELHRIGYTSAQVALYFLMAHCTACGGCDGSPRKILNVRTMFHNDDHFAEKVMVGLFEE